MIRFPLPTPDLAHREIIRDAACRGLAPQDQCLLSRSCWDLGRGAARTWLPTEAEPLASVLGDHGLRVEEDEQELGQWGGFVSEYRRRGRVVVLHRGALRQWAQESGLEESLLERIALSHEFFHDLDCQGHVDTDRVSRVREWTVAGRTVWSTRSRGALEACAHGFSSTVVPVIQR
jgi:hypothetical protein